MDTLYEECKENDLAGIFRWMLPYLLNNRSTDSPLNFDASAMYDADLEQFRRIARGHTGLMSKVSYSKQVK